MTEAHLLTQYKHFKDLLENPIYAEQKKVWKDNVQHGMDSILIIHPEFKDISGEEEEKTKEKPEEKPKKKEK